MKQAIAEQWIKALRSGEYKQTSGQLRANDGFCCLGVLCNLHAQAHPKIAAKEIDPTTYLGEDSGLPKQVRQWAGVKSGLGEIDSEDPWHPIKIRDGKFESLADANDCGVSFEHIATWVEQNYKAL